jgi:hypothetical protein
VKVSVPPTLSSRMSRKRESLRSGPRVTFRGACIVLVKQRIGQRFGLRHRLEVARKILK